MTLFNDVNDVILHSYFLVGGLFLSYISFKIFHSLFETNHRKTKLRTRGHTWNSIQCNKSIPFNKYCTICFSLMMPIVGLFCECCAVSACKKCYKKADKKFLCKALSWPFDKTFFHQWVNVGPTTVSNPGDGESKYFCSWCQRTKVFRADLIGQEPCDFQKYRKLIIPPSHVSMEKGMVTNVKSVPDDDWEPLFVFANRKSGSNRSNEVLTLFRGLLNPIQVVDLSMIPPENVVRWMPRKCRVLAAGGDGTIAWVTGAIKEAGRELKAPVAILPMGTGNDLSRVLGWGSTCVSVLDAHDIITDVQRAREQKLDRWKITIKPKRSRLSRSSAEKVLYAYNYASIGVDAQVTLDFHNARKQFLYRYANRSINYFAYLLLGANRALDGGCDGLESRLRVLLNSRRDPLPLPPLQSLVLLNIPSWGAGVDLWSLGDEENIGEQNIEDGVLEILGISSSFHIARLRCGLATPYRFGQASTVHIDLEGSCPMQVDGEPWMQGPATIHIEYAGDCLMLRANCQSVDHADTN